MSIDKKSLTGGCDGHNGDIESWIKSIYCLRNNDCDDNNPFAIDKCNNDAKKYSNMLSFKKM